MYCFLFYTNDEFIMELIQMYHEENNKKKQLLRNELQLLFTLRIESNPTNLYVFTSYTTLVMLYQLNYSSLILAL